MGTTPNYSIPTPNDGDQWNLVADLDALALATDTAIKGVADTTVPVSKGGTGATTVAGAQDNLRIGLVNIVPSNVTPVGAGSSASYDSTSGLITFATCTGVNIDGVFTSTFSRYRIIISVPSLTTLGGGAILRFRNAGVDNSTANYGQSVLYVRTNGATSNNSGTSNNAISVITGANSTTNVTFASIDIRGMQENIQKSMTWIGQGQDSGGVYANYAAAYFSDTTKTFDGITFYYGGSGTFGGTIQFFGYRE